MITVSNERTKLKSTKETEMEKPNVTRNFIYEIDVTTINPCLILFFYNFTQL